MITINDFVKMNDTDKCNLVNKHLQNHTQKTSSKERLDLHSVKQTRFFQNVTSIIWRAHTAPANRLFNLLKTRKKNRSERISPQNK